MLGYAGFYGVGPVAQVDWLWSLGLGFGFEGFDPSPLRPFDKLRTGQAQPERKVVLHDFLSSSPSHSLG
jgi:hypothetical protein